MSHSWYANRGAFSVDHVCNNSNGYFQKFAVALEQGNFLANYFSADNLTCRMTSPLPLHYFYQRRVDIIDQGPRLQRNTQTRLKTNLKLTVLNNTKLRHF